ncbi:MAG: ChbG/HpnK family deacetylase [Crocinitomicaceae bacterium]|nr:ChbG/HpnK family deacetylase [Crocinitomicaceae bacterium]
MNNKVIITADDYGVCDRIDRGIEAAIAANKLTSVSAIITHEDSLERVKRLYDLQQKKAKEGQPFGIGLHLCITSGKPQSQSSVGSLVAKDGNFHEASYYPFGTAKADHLKDEIKAQFEKISKAIPIKELDHLTNHHGIVYFKQDLFEAFVDVAAEHKVSVRSPMSWHPKFKKFEELPDFDENPIGNPTIRRGMKIGVWRKLGQVSYGNLVRRMEYSEEKKVNYPDVLCEFIYGQCTPKRNNGVKVMEHVFHQFMDPADRETENKNRPKKEEIVVDRVGIALANQHTIDQAYSKIKNGGANGKHEVVSRYGSKKYTGDFSVELMFHLAERNVPTPSEIHGINMDYFVNREHELDALLAIDLEKFKNKLKLSYIPYKDL